MKQLTATVAALSLLVLGGCASSNTSPTETESSEAPGTAEVNTGESTSTPEEDAENTTTSSESAMNGSISITKAEATGNRTLMVEFNVSEEASADAEGYRLLLSNNDEPTWPTQGYWYQLGTAHTSKEWKGLPIGERYLRTCIVKNDVCAEYSNTKKVEIE